MSINIYPESIDRNITGPVTAFGDLRNAELSPILQTNFDYTVDNTEITTNTITNGGTVTQADAMALVGTSTTTNSTALLMSKQVCKYKSGLGGLLRFTSLFTTPVAATEQYIGLADEEGSTVAFEDGYMIGYNGTNFGLHRFKNDTQTTVAQSSFDDPLDGTGASGITLDTTKLNAWEIRYQYLGAGAIELWLESQYTGKFILVHTLQYANQNTTPSVYNTNFRAAVFTNNKATTSNLVLKTASFAYFVEGKNIFLVPFQPQKSSGSVQKTTVTTETALFTIRSNSTYASKTNFIETVLELMSVSIEASSANNLGNMRLVRNTTLGGVPSYADINTSDSTLEIDVAGTTLTGGQELISVELAGKNDRFVEKLLEYNILLFPTDTITLAVSSSNSATFNGSLLMKELF
jgi:hypothetical protein